MGLLGSGSSHMAGRYAAAIISRPQAGAANPSCQRCYQKGHWTYECKNDAVYIARPSRTQQLKNPKVRQRFLQASELPEDPKAEKKEAEGKKKKKKAASSSGSGSSSDSDSSSSSSSSSSDGSSSSDDSSSSSSGSDSDSSSSSGSDSSTDSDSSNTSGSTTSSDGSKGPDAKVTKIKGALQPKAPERPVYPGPPPLPGRSGHQDAGPGHSYDPQGGEPGRRSYEHGTGQDVYRDHYSDVPPRNGHEEYHRSQHVRDRERTYDERPARTHSRRSASPSRHEEGRAGEGHKRRPDDFKEASAQPSKRRRPDAADVQDPAQALIPSELRGRLDVLRKHLDQKRQQEPGSGAGRQVVGDARELIAAARAAGGRAVPTARDDVDLGMDVGVDEGERWQLDEEDAMLDVEPSWRQHEGQDLRPGSHGRQAHSTGAAEGPLAQSSGGDGGREAAGGRGRGRGQGDEPDPVRQGGDSRVDDRSEPEWPSREDLHRSREGDRSRRHNGRDDGTGDGMERKGSERVAARESDQPRARDAREGHRAREHGEARGQEEREGRAREHGGPRAQQEREGRGGTREHGEARAEPEREGRQAAAADEQRGRGENGQRDRGPERGVRERERERSPDARRRDRPRDDRPPAPAAARRDERRPEGGGEERSRHMEERHMDYQQRHRGGRDGGSPGARERSPERRRGGELDGARARDVPADADRRARSRSMPARQTPPDAGRDERPAQRAQASSGASSGSSSSSSGGSSGGSGSDTTSS